MKEIVQKWLKFAESDLDAADYLFHKPRANQWTFILVVWHCHQAVEKILKAIIIHQGKEILRIHDLPKLWKLTNLTDLLEGQTVFLFELNQHYLTPRYPDMPLKKSYPLITKNKAKEVLIKTKDLFLCFTKNLN